MICSYCKSEVDDDLMFCPKCGNILKQTNQETEKPPEPKPAPTPAPAPKPVVVKRKSWIVVSVIQFIIIFCLASYVINQNNQIESLSSANGTLLSKNAQQADMLKKIFPEGLFVAVQSVYNGDYNNNKLSDDLNSNTLQFLTFNYTLNCLDDNLSSYDGKEIKIKIIQPSGTLMQGTNSPYDFTTSQTIGSSSTMSIGWGNAQGNAFYAGNYKIQFYLNSNLIGEKDVYVN